MKNPHSAFERKVASLLIGVHGILYGVMPLLDTHNASGFMRHMHSANYSASWYALMALSGLLLCIGSLLPCRSLRHVGLTVAVFVYGSIGTEFMITGQMIPVTFTFLMLPAFAMWLLIDDVRRKKREPSR